MHALSDSPSIGAATAASSRAVFSMNEAVGRAPKDLAGWMRALERFDIPVLAASAAAIEALAKARESEEDAVDAHLVADSLDDDPLMILKALRHVAGLVRGRPRLAAAENLTQALMMMGLGPFFRHFGQPPVAEAMLAHSPQALTGLRMVLKRSRRAARFAQGMAAQRGDHDSALLHEAALLHDFTELLLWVHAPDLALAVQRQLALHPGLRSAQAQQEVLNITVAELRQALLKQWAMPELLVHLADEEAAQEPRVRNVSLAIRLARHSANGWSNPALPDDLSDIAQLLNLGREPTFQLLQRLDSRL